MSYKNHKADCTCRLCWLAEHDPRYKALWQIKDTNTTAPIALPCVNLGDEIETIECPTCKGNVKVKVFECAKYGQCTLAKPIGNIPCCSGTPSGGQIVRCPSYSPRPITTFNYPPPSTPALKWSYGVMTVAPYQYDPKERLAGRRESYTKDRMTTLLPQTLRSLTSAGFEKPRLFIDGEGQIPEIVKPYISSYSQRIPRAGVTGAWALAMLELYWRDPWANRYALFQDDLLAVKNLRAYLDSCPYPEKGYLNLYTFPSNEKVVFNGSKGWKEGRLLDSTGMDKERLQKGAGAVGLVFSREALEVLFTSLSFFRKPQDANQGHVKVDGAIVGAMNKAGWREWVHSPSLLQHTGKRSAVGNLPHPIALTFPGENFDCLSLLEK